MALVIYDFDNTLFPTTGEDWTKISAEQWSLLAATVTHLINYSREINTTVVIVTNATRSWVDLCLRTYLPSLLDLFNTLEIISCMDVYRQIYPDQPFRWKQLIFRQLSWRGLYTSIISIGDSEVERLAIQELRYSFPIYWCKSIKLCDNPSIIELLNQHKVLINHLLQIVAAPHHIDTMLIPKVKVIMEVDKEGLVIVSMGYSIS